MTGSHAKCTKRFARIARRSARSLLSPAAIARSTAKSATRSGKIAAVNNKGIATPAFACFSQAEQGNFFNFFLTSGKFVVYLYP